MSRNVIAIIFIIIGTFIDRILHAGIAWLFFFFFFALLTIFKVRKDSTINRIVFVISLVVIILGIVRIVFGVI